MKNETKKYWYDKADQEKEGWLTQMRNKQCEWCHLPAKWWMRRDDYVRYCCGLHIKQTAELIRLDLNCGATYKFGPLNPVTGKEEK